MYAMRVSSASNLSEALRVSTRLAGKGPGTAVVLGDATYCNTLQRALLLWIYTQKVVHVVVGQHVFCVGYVCST